MPKRIDLMRGERIPSAVADVMRYKTRDGRFAIEHSHPTLGQNERWADRWRILVRTGESWGIVAGHDGHRTRHAAELALAELNPACLVDDRQPEAEQLTAAQRRVLADVAAAGQAGLEFSPAASLAVAAAANVLARRGLVTIARNGAKRTARLAKPD